MWNYLWEVYVCLPSFFYGSIFWKLKDEEDTIIIDSVSIDDRAQSAILINQEHHMPHKPYK